MRWTPEEQSPDLEDQRGSSGGGGGGGGFGLPHLGIGGLIVVALLSLIFHRNFFAFFSGGGGTPAGAPVAASSSPSGAPVSESKEEHDQREFTNFVLNHVQQTWADIFAKNGQTYRHAKLVLFRDGVRSGCGYAQTEMGPFYCPADEKVYIDLGFYKELRDRFGAKGDFAQAYVIAHEFGHHIQKLLGISDKVEAAQQQNPRQAKPLSVRLELQADCFAGVWASQQQKILDPGDVDDAMNAASAVGDDRIQKQATGQVNPETWTHGSAAQRSHWFKTGFDGASIKSCDTFNSRE
jgi:predicted metalloprotease